MNYSNGNPPRSKQTAKASKYPQGKFESKPCRACGEMFQPESPYHFYCCQECMDWGYTDKYLQRNYNMTICDFIEMYERQGGRCAICGCRGFKMKNSSMTSLVVDHDHETGKVRGLLCHNCNRALGSLHDDIPTLLQAVNYLKGATTIP